MVKVFFPEVLQINGVLEQFFFSFSVTHHAEP